MTIILSIIGFYLISSAIEEIIKDAIKKAIKETKHESER